MSANNGEIKPALDRQTAINAVRDRIVNSLLVLVAAMGVPVIIITLPRSLQFGFKPVQYITFIAIFIFILAALFRRRLPFNLRAGVIILAAQVVATFSLLSWGLAGLGVCYLLTNIFVASIVYSPRVGIALAGIGVAIMVIAAVVFHLGWQTIDFDAQAFLVAPSSWVMAVVHVGAFSAAVIIAYYWFNQALVGSIESLDRRTEELEQANRRLEEEIVERREIEERLRLTQFSVDNASVPAFWINDDGTILYANLATCRLSGYSLEELVGTTFFRIVPGIGAENFRELWDQIAREGEYHAKQTMRDRSGREFPAEITAKYLEFLGRKYVFGYAQDISEQELLEEQFLQSQKMEAVGRLAGGVAHDFNNQLTVIFSVCDMLLHTLNPQDPNYRMIEMIKSAGEKSAGLTRQLLAFSRKQIVSPRLLNLNAVLTDLQKMLGRIIGEDVKLSLRLDGDLGLVRVDPVQCEQVIINLAVNARDAMPEGGRLAIETANITVDENFVRTRIDMTPGEYVVMAVSDTGSGMDRETLEHIFEPFFTTKSREQGTGLGLATVYGIVKQAGGSIGVYSEPGAGSTFRIYLPRVNELPESEEKQARAEEPLGGDEVILLAEDDATVREATTQILAGRGYQVLAAASGEEALEVFEKRKSVIDLLVTDVIMTGMNGRELARRVREIRPQLGVLFISGYTDDVIAHHGVLDPDIDYLPKPFPAKALLKKVREIIDRE